MTEAEWRTCVEPKALFERLKSCPPLTQRKILLFAVACCRRFTSSFSQPVFVNALDVLERFAERQATNLELATVALHGLQVDIELAIVESDVSDLWNPELLPMADAVSCGSKALLQATPPDSPSYFLSRSIDDLLDSLTTAFLYASPTALKQSDEQGRLADFVREVFGNPFRPLAVDHEWRTSTVTLLAQGIYQERTFEQLPILADALQDAGCEHDDILNHLRDPNATHVRGCWALDMVLGKA